MANHKLLRLSAALLFIEIALFLAHYAGVRAG